MNQEMDDYWDSIKKRDFEYITRFEGVNCDCVVDLYEIAENIISACKKYRDDPIKTWEIFQDIDDYHYPYDDEPKDLVQDKIRDDLPMHWYGPLILRWIYGLTRINDTYLYANQTVEQILNNHYKNNDWKANEEKEYKLYKLLKEEKEQQIFRNPAKVRNNEQPDGNVTSTFEEIKLIYFEGGTETILKLFNALYGFFPESETELKNVLGGKPLIEPLLFQGKCNQFVEVFRRLKYNHLIVSNYSEIRDWICLNFAFKGIHNIKNFKKSTVYDILKGKSGTEPTKKQRILQDLDWLPYTCSEKLAAIKNLENLEKTIPPKYPKSI